MKTWFLLLALCVAISGYGQSLYPDGGTVTADGITFKVENNIIFTLDNTANVYCDDPNWHYKDGRELETRDEYDAVHATAGPTAQERAIREAFGDELLLSLRAAYATQIYCPLSIFYVVGPEGDTLEVSFIMNADSILLSIPPEVYAALEHNLKKYVKWKVNEFGKKLLFIQTMSAIPLKNVPLNSEFAKLKPDGWDADSDLLPDVGGKDWKKDPF